MKKALLVFAMLVLSAHAAVSFHAANSSVSQNGGSLVTTLPTVSNNDYVLCAAAANAIPATNVTPYATPSGWTALVDVAGQAVFGKKWLTGDPTTVTIVPQNSTGSWEVSDCVSYTGVDTTTPIDGAANSFLVSYDAVTPSTNFSRCPSTSPAFTNDQLVCFYFDYNAGGITVTLPGALTSRVNDTNGPTIRIGDEALGSGNATGNLDATYSGHSRHGAAQILLKAASGGSPAVTAVQPTFGGIRPDSTTSGGFSALFPFDGDLIVVTAFEGGAGMTVSGYTTVFATTDVGIYVKVWHTGDAMTYSSSGGTTNHDENVAIIRNYNPTGVTLVSPSVDSSGTATPVGSGTTINSPSIAAAGASELLLVIYAAGTNPTGYSGTWTIPGGLGYDFSYNSSSIISDGEGSLQAPSNPTGNFTGTASSATNLGSGAVSFKIGGTALVPRKSVVF